MNGTILICDDEIQIRNLLRIGLETNGFRVIESSSGEDCLNLLMNKSPAEVLILDLGLPGMSGIETLRKLRSWSTIPIIILSVQDRDREKVEALDAGADDYLSKPFSMDELTARIRVALRRRDHVQPDREYRFGNLYVNFSSRIIKKNGQEVHLTDLEFRVLALLVKHSGRVLTHSQILKEVWGPRQQDALQYLRMYIASLRKKLEDDPSHPQLILTETGVGYRLKEE